MNQAPDEKNAAEIEYWNGPGGLRWMRMQPTLDALLSPVTDVLMKRAAAKGGESVLDVGCGCGPLSIALARQVAPAGRVLGIDVSGPMIDYARNNSPAGLPVEFALADATDFDFSGLASDLLFSRFGVMFFADPVRSFANLRQGLRRGGRVVFACWREPRMNSWAMAPLQEAYRHVPKLPQPGLEDPGPFSFADQARVHRILETAGFDSVALEPVELSFDLAVGRGLDGAVETATSVGPASRALDGQPDTVRQAAAESIRTMLADHRSGDRVLLPGAIWIVTARNP